MPLASARLARCSAKLDMPMKTVGFSDSISPSCTSDGTELPAPTQFMPTSNQCAARGPDLAGRVNADRERHMHEVALADPDARKRAAPCQQPVSDVFGGARIEHRFAGRAAGAPEFRDLGMRHRAELLHEAGVIERAQDVLVEDRNGLPHRRIVEPARIDVVELAAIPGQRTGRDRTRSVCVRSGSSRSRRAISAIAMEAALA